MTSSKPTSPVDTQDAIDLLTDDHKKVQKLFKEFEKLKDNGDSEEKLELVRQVCQELTIHTQIEEEIFYPAARAALSAQDLLDEAEVEHASAKELIAQLEAMEGDEPLYDAKFTVLGEYVNHHIKEEEGELFPQVKKTKIDTVQLGGRLQERKTQLQSEQGTEVSSPAA